MLYKYSLASFLCRDGVQWFGRPGFVSRVEGLELLAEDSPKSFPDGNVGAGRVSAISISLLLRNPQ